MIAILQTPYKPSRSVSLADQLSGQFSIFFGWPKENCPVSQTGQFFCSLSWIFCSFFFLKIGHSLISKLDKKNQESGQKKCLVFESRQFSFGRPIKWEINRTIGQPRDWTKPHGHPYWRANYFGARLVPIFIQN